MTHLHSLAVELCRNTQSLRVLDQRGTDDARTIGSPSIKAFAEGPLTSAPLELPLSVRNIIADRIAQDVVKRLGLGHIGAFLADDGYQLAFVVKAFALLGHGVDRDRIKRSSQRSDRFVLTTHKVRSATTHTNNGARRLSHK